MNYGITERVEKLRDYLRRNGLCAFIIPSTDPHQGEYVPAHWQTRQWISGFDGSAGTAVVTLSDAALWTDSRYFIAAAQQLEGTPFRLMKDGLPETPTITQWLIVSIQTPKSKIQNEAGIQTANGQWSMVNDATVGIDGKVFTSAEIEELKAALGKAGIQLRTDLDPAEELWTDRPPIPKNKVEIQPLEFAGETAESKIERVRQALREQKAGSIVISALDDIAWLLNMRGTDIHCNPVFVSHVLLTQHDVTLCIDSDKLDETASNYLQSIGVKVRPYEPSPNSSLAGRGEDSSPGDATTPLPARKRPGEGLVSSLKSVKNAAEIAGFRRAMVRDGVAMVRFLRWLKPAVEAGGQTELSIDRKLTALRAEQDLYRGLSFDTIAAYGPHGAIVHYEATPETNVRLEPKGLLLLDSGAQYQDGTTDITRTIPLGPLTEEERTDYTLVLKGHIRLALARFPDGISGTQIDALARYDMWQHGINYGHGTGHGVGSYLCVHEGPHQIRHTWKPAPLHAGMTVTDEPGIYREGRHGVRIENTMLIVADGETEFGSFLRLQPLTLCPIDLSPVRWDMMLPDEVAYINDYHRKVREELSPLLNEEERQWLDTQCTKVNVR